jgi:predicted RNA binding protein YcfA (HicA-like mRNA interferase family)
MPKKIRELKAMLKKAGFQSRLGKGSHTVWTHSRLPKKRITIAGNDGNDAKPYLEKHVESAIRESEETK